MGRAEPGGILAARYQLLAVLGRDEIGIVWLARDGLLHRDVAVKAVPLAPLPKEAGQEAPRQRVLRDAGVLAQLDHPNIPAVFGIVEDGGSTWMVLQAAPFRSPYRPLGDVVRDDGPLPPERAAEAGVQLLSALRAAHAVGVRHGDIRPGNVLLGPGNWAMLTGFGMVTAYDGRAAGAPAGSPCYLAPERASGQPVTLAADLWSLGAILYAAVEGRPPFHGDGRAAVLAAVVSGHPDLPSRAGPLWPVISGLLRKDADARPDAAGADWLLRRVAGGHDAAGPEPPAEPAGAPASADPAPASRLEADREDAVPAMMPAPLSTAAADDGATGDSQTDSAADFIPGFGPREPESAGGAAAGEDPPAETALHDDGRQRWFFAATVRQG
jgi:eukaryotic-like serine/threonine-protein kinase